jgi:hypothetical protein
MASKYCRSALTIVYVSAADYPDYVKNFFKRTTMGGSKRHTSAYTACIAYLLIRAIKYEITAIKIEISLSHLFSYQEVYAF